jgi:hypothetical protein
VLVAEFTGALQISQEGTSLLLDLLCVHAIYSLEERERETELGGGGAIRSLAS